MAKITDLGLAKPDDPIFSGGLQVHFKPPLTKSTGDTPSSTDGGLQPGPTSSAAASNAATESPMLAAQNGMERALRKGLEDSNPGFKVDPNTGELVPIQSK